MCQFMMASSGIRHSFLFSILLFKISSSSIFSYLNLSILSKNNNIALKVPQIPDIKYVAEYLDFRHFFSLSQTKENPKAHNVIRISLNFEKPLIIPPNITLSWIPYTSIIKGLKDTDNAIKLMIYWIKQKIKTKV